MSSPRPIVLASRSPRRLELLQEAGWAVSVEVPHVDDGLLDCGESVPVDWVAALAWLKARGTTSLLAARNEPSACTVLGADTICVLQGRIIGQPVDRVDARAMLESFVGVTHEVMTGVCLIDWPEQTRRILVETAHVRMGDLAPEAIDAYLEGDAWRGKAGGYNLADRLADGWPIKCTGDQATVMGLPMQRLSELLGDSVVRA